MLSCRLPSTIEGSAVWFLVVVSTGNQCWCVCGWLLFVVNKVTHTESESSISKPVSRFKESNVRPKHYNTAGKPIKHTWCCQIDLVCIHITSPFVFFCKHRDTLIWFQCLCCWFRRTLCILSNDSSINCLEPSHFGGLSLLAQWSSHWCAQVVVPMVNQSDMKQITNAICWWRDDEKLKWLSHKPLWPTVVN